MSRNIIFVFLGINSHTIEVLLYVHVILPTYHKFFIIYIKVHRKIHELNTSKGEL
jgi:hypothetical protein